MAEVKYPCYWQRKDNGGYWYWIFYAANREAIARSSESYVNRSDCSHSIALMKGSASDPIFYSD